MEPAAESDDFSTLYAAVAPRLFAWASLHVGSGLRTRLDPEDLMQEVACRSFARFSTFDRRKGKFDQWLFGIARNVLLQTLERASRRESNATADWLTTGSIHQVPDEATSVTRRIARDEELQRFLSLIAELPDEDRDLMLYRGLEGLPHGQVATLLGIDERLAAKRWERLRGRVRESASRLDLAPD